LVNLFESYDDAQARQRQIQKIYQLNNMSRFFCYTEVIRV